MNLLSPSGRPYCMMTLFLENSTRTKLSFAHAALRMGCHYLDFPVEQSSLQKGESLTETLLTMRAQGVDLMVIRSSDDQLYHPWRQHVPIKIVNGGNGISEHPSQALLDFFTFQQDQLPVKDSTLSIIGDVRHSRVANSLMALAGHFNVNIMLSGPDHFRPKFSLPPHVRWESDINKAYTQATRIYLLRIQHERHGGKTTIQETNQYLHDYGLSLNRYQQLKLRAPVYHPGPCNIGTELDEALLRSSHYRAYQQVAMSIPMRQAILECMLTKSPELPSILTS